VSGDEVAPSKANAHLALLCDQWIKPEPAGQQAIATVNLPVLPE
jgi:hypothetical protein